MRPIVSQAIENISPYEPGKPIEELERELGARWPQVGAIKLASNENPLGASRKAIAAMAQTLEQIALYPDSGWFYLRRDLAEKLKVSAGQLVLGAGSNELIDLIVQTYTEAEEEVLTYAYSFVCYKLAAEAHRRPFREVKVGMNFSYSVDDLLSQVQSKTKVVFVANPNNPTGTYLPAAELETLVRKLPPEILLVIDEAYFEYAQTADYPDALAYLHLRERMMVLRTFSKIYGLAGIRVGYGVGAETIVQYMHRVRLPFNVNAVAQAAARAALTDDEHVLRSRQSNGVELPRVSEGLRRLGHDVFPSIGNFVLMRAQRANAGEIHRMLLERGVIVRPMGFYQLPDCLRISIGTADQNDRLLQTMVEIG